MKAPTKAKTGGLTAAGRRDFLRRTGAHLKPGVRKPLETMSPEEIRRKGSWAVRFYGRDKLPPLKDSKGNPTRFALTAHAWGEEIPSTVAEARAIARKGRSLLKKYNAEKSASPKSKKASR
jgi:Domain of unknown function (DUF6321)